MISFEKVQKQIASQLNVKPETIKPETDIVKDLKADSLDVVEMVMALEEEFKITIPEDKVTQMKTAGDLAEFIDSLKK